MKWEEVSFELPILCKSHMQQEGAALQNVFLFTQCVHAEYNIMIFL